MTSPVKNGRAGHASSSHRNYKYRRLSSVEKGSDDSYVSCDEDEEELFSSQTMELRKLGGKPKKSTTIPLNFISEYDQLVDRPIRSGETLRSISLKYRVPLSELKRINNIMQENEFFALSSLKIPIKPNSVLAEMLEEEKKDDARPCDQMGQSNVSSARAALLGTRNMSSCSEYESESEMHVGYISIDRILKDTRTKKEAKKFLDNMQKDLANIRAKTNTYKDSLDEAAAALNDLRFRPLEPPENDAVWGMSWTKIFCIALTVLIGGPLVYLFYYFHKHQPS